jgi:hypothetical protein
MLCHDENLACGKRIAWREAVLSHDCERSAADVGGLLLCRITKESSYIGQPMQLLACTCRYQSLDRAVEEKTNFCDHKLMDVSHIDVISRILMITIDAT